MKVTLNPKWKPRPFQSFLGFMDLKTGECITVFWWLLIFLLHFSSGVTIALLFAVRSSDLAHGLWIGAEAVRIAFKQSGWSVWTYRRLHWRVSGTTQHVYLFGVRSGCFDLGP